MVSLAVLSVPAEATDPETTRLLAAAAKKWLVESATPDGTHLVCVELVNRSTGVNVRITGSEPAEALSAADALLTSWRGDWSPTPAADSSPQDQLGPGDSGRDGEPVDGRSASARVLAVAAEWLPTRGGISAFNRYLCRALAAAGADVYCVIPSASRLELADADASSVTLLEAPPGPGAGPHDGLLRRPTLPGGVAPDIVVGHGRITGPYAQALTDEHFPSARRAHFVHMTPDEQEWLQSDGPEAAALAESRTEIELALGAGAACVLGVGPRLDRWVRRELASLPERPEALRFDPGFDGADETARRPPPGDPQVLLLGRIGSTHVKGLDIAAGAVGHAVRLRGDDAETVDVLLRGVPAEQAASLRAQVRQWAGLPSLAVLPRAFSTDDAQLRRDLRRASLLLMPSRAEGFGLVGLEAIAAGTPVLVSAESGLGELLREILGEGADLVVLPVTGDLDTDEALWGERVHAVLADRERSFAAAGRLREVMSGRYTWAMAARQFLDALLPITA